MAFLPDGSMLVTERPGRIRVVRHGRVDPVPVAGVPAVKTGGLQGLMADRELRADDGATTLARGTWNGTALVDVRDMFESGATQTESSRMTFYTGNRFPQLHQRIRDVRQGPDGLLYVVTAEDEGALLRLEPLAGC